MRFQRLFSTEKAGGYAGVRFRTTDSEIRAGDGRVLHDARDIEAPADWSQTAVDILAQKYLRKAGVPAKTRRMKEKGVPDFLTVAKGFGWQTLDLDAASDPQAALKTALTTRGPMLIHASIAMREQVLPMVAPGAANKDMIGG
ncbi:MAG TPA: hypothetical protein PKM48_15395, partial [Parvularculaceae bacterium]|nr:hypothetical protein [Parvularculaceae bacterium]